jgi:protein SCO1/2
MSSNAETPRRNLTRAAAPALIAALVAAAAALFLVGQIDDKNAPPPAPRNCILEGAEQMGGPISLVDTHGTPVTQADFAGQPAILYFGYTHCPSVCPTTMYALANALSQPGGYDIQPVLISVDPERDTPEVLGEYVRTNGFPAGLEGLTGTPAQVQAAEAAFRVYARRSSVQGAPASAYEVDHTSFLYVMDGAWRTRAVISSAEATPSEIAACIAAGLESHPSRG